MKLDAKSEKRILYIELEKKLKELDKFTMQEAVFAHFMPTKRKFRADFLLPNLKVIVEVNGGQFIGGRHNRGGKGYENDLCKLNLAQINGYKVLQFTYEMIRRGDHIKTLNLLKM